MYNGVQRSAIVYINCGSIQLTFQVTRVFFLSNGVHYVFVSLVRAGQWAWELGLYVDGGAAVRKLRNNIQST